MWSEAGLLGFERDLGSLGWSVRCPWDIQSLESQRPHRDQATEATGEASKEQDTGNEP